MVERVADFQDKLRQHWPLSKQREDFDNEIQREQIIQYFDRIKVNQWGSSKKKKDQGQELYSILEAPRKARIKAKKTHIYKRGSAERRR